MYFEEEKMARETECSVCYAYIPLEPEDKLGDQIFCSFCGAQLILEKIDKDDDDNEIISTEEDY
jgi:rRNA maturation endonuclease Nob1